MPCLFQRGVNMTALLIILQSRFIDISLVKYIADLIKVDSNVLEAFCSAKRTCVWSSISDKNRLTFYDKRKCLCWSANVSDHSEESSKYWVVLLFLSNDSPPLYHCASNKRGEKYFVRCVIVFICHNFCWQFLTCTMFYSSNERKGQPLSLRCFVFQ